MKSLEELRRLRETLQQDMLARNGDGNPRIIVGMGTCGIAAGAREVMQAIMQQVRERNITVTISQTGCIGMCEKEPLLDVQLPGKGRITYGHVTPKDVERIIVQHVINGQIVEDLVVARLEEGEGQ